MKNYLASIFAWLLLQGNSPAQILSSVYLPFPHNQLEIDRLFVTCLPVNASTETAHVKSLSVTESVLNEAKGKYENETDRARASYDKNGRISLYEELNDPENAYDPGPLLERFGYDENGKILWWNNETGDSYSATDTFYYQGNGKLFSICDYSILASEKKIAGGCFNFQYHADGRILSITQTNCGRTGKTNEPLCADQESRLRFTYEYSEQGRVEKISVKEVEIDGVYDETTDKVRYVETGSELSEIYLYTYNAAGKLISFAARKPDQELVETLHFNYNEKGQLVMAERAEGDGFITVLKIDWNEKNLPAAVYWGDAGNQSEPVFTLRWKFKYRYW